MEKVAVVIVDYNSNEDTIGCIDSIKRNGNWENLAIVVVCNGDCDENAILVVGATNLYQLPDNVGYCKGNNTGIEIAAIEGADYVLILNPDTRIDDKNTIPGLIKTFQKFRQVGAVTPLINNDIKQTVKTFPSPVDMVAIYCFGGTFKFLARNHFGRGRVYSGCCIMFSMDALEDIGYFPEEIFMYWDEAIMVKKLHEHHYAILVEHSLSVWHRGETNLKRNPELTSTLRKYNFESMMYYVDNYSGFGWLGRNFVRAAIVVEAMAAYLLQGRYDRSVEREIIHKIFKD